MPPPPPPPKLKVALLLGNAAGCSEADDVVEKLILGGANDTLELVLVDAAVRDEVGATPKLKPSEIAFRVVFVPPNMDFCSCGCTWTEPPVDDLKFPIPPAKLNVGAVIVEEEVGVVVTIEMELVGAGKSELPDDV